MLEIDDMTRRRLRKAPRKMEMERVRLFDKPPGVRRLVEVKEACRYGHMSPATLYRKMKAGRIKAYKDGRRTLIDLNTMDADHNSLPEIRLQARR
jgi:excisionase family DNA binding protein